MTFELINTNGFFAVKDRLFMKTVNYDFESERNDVLSVCPYERKLNLAFVPYVLLADTPSYMIARVTYELIDSWNMTETEIMSIAKTNTPKLFPKVISSLDDMILNGNMEDNLDFNGPIVITNKSKFCGATVLFYPGILEMIHKGMGNFYALPSSIHEWILMPDNNSFNVNAEYLSHMVRDINENEVAATDRLSDYVYYCDGNNFTIVA